MPLITTNSDLEIEMPGTIDLAGESLIRKIKIINLQYNIENKNITVEGVVFFYDQNNEQVQSNIFKPYSVKIIIDNETYCDMQGNTLCTVTDISNEATAAAEASAKDEPFTPQFAPLLEGINYMKEFDYFSKIAQEDQVNIHQLIENNILKAIQENKIN